MGAPTDEQLLQQFIAGDSSAFELIVRRHMRELYQFVVRFTSDSVAAEDVVQDTLIQVHRSAESFDPEKRFKPWLFTIAANKARDFIRRRTRRRELPINAKMTEEDQSSQHFVDLFSAELPEPDSEMMTEEGRKFVRQVVEAMPEKLREILILAYFHRLPYRDIADVVGIPVGTVKSRLHAAVAAFRKGYEACQRQPDPDEP